MGLLMFLSEMVIPLLIFCIVGYGLLCGHNIYEEFLEGAKDGIEDCGWNYADSDRTDGCGWDFKSIRFPDISD